MTSPKKQDANSLDSKTRIDDRWTLHKLFQAGYEEEWSKSCRGCGDPIQCYRHTKTQRMLILNETVLTPHSCTER